MSRFARLSQIAPIFLVAFLAGVFLASVFHIEIVLIGCIFLVGASAAFSAWKARSLRMLLITVLCIGLSGGMYRFVLWDMAPLDPALESSLGAVHEYKGVVTDEPDVREGNVHLTITFSNIREGSSTRQVVGTALIIAPRFPAFAYGDEIVLTGIVKHPEVFTEKDGRVFDYPSYLRSKDIRYQMLFPKMHKVGEGKASRVAGVLFSIKAKFVGAIGYALPAPHSALLSGLLLGGKQSLGAAWLDKFRTAGIIHIIVLSGYNMTLVSEWLVVAFRFLGFYGSLSVGSIGIVLFAIMTGGGATVMRAAIMAVLVLLAKATGRNFDMGRALLLAGALMVLQNPSILLYDPSFQLSFLASLGLIYISPIVDRHTTLFKKMPIPREVFVSTLATQVMVLPLLLSQTGMFSLIALPVNLIVLPVIPLTMLLGFISAVVTLVLPPLGAIAAYPAYVLLAWILNVADYASQIPYASVAVTSVTPKVALVLYVLLVSAIWYEQRRVRVTQVQAPEVPPLN